MVSLQKMQSLAYGHRFALPLRYTTRMPLMMRGRNAAMLRIPRASLPPQRASRPPITQWMAVFTEVHQLLIIRLHWHHKPSGLMVKGLQFSKKPKFHGLILYPRATC